MNVGDQIQVQINGGPNGLTLGGPNGASMNIGPGASMSVSGDKLKPDSTEFSSGFEPI